MILKADDDVVKGVDWVLGFWIRAVGWFNGVPPLLDEFWNFDRKDNYTCKLRMGTNSQIGWRPRRKDND